MSDRARPAHRYERVVGGVVTHVRHEDSGNRSPSVLTCVLSCSVDRSFNNLLFLLRHEQNLPFRTEKCAQTKGRAVCSNCQVSVNISDLWLDFSSSKGVFLCCCFLPGGFKGLPGLLPLYSA